MLNIYLYKPLGCEMNNDKYFMVHTCARLKDYEDRQLLLDILGAIDGCTDCDFDACTSTNRFGVAHDMKDLSLGCKTALNVLLNPDVIFYGQECGENAYRLILAMDGNIYLHWLPYTEELNSRLQYAFHPNVADTSILSYREGLDEYAPY